MQDSDTLIDTGPCSFFKVYLAPCLGELMGSVKGPPQPGQGCLPGDDVALWAKSSVCYEA